METVAYIRTSTKTNKDRGGKARATRAITKALQSQKVDRVIHDVVSGSAPLCKRTKLIDLLTKRTHTSLKTIAVEGTRDLACNLIAAEELLASALCQPVTRGCLLQRRPQLRNSLGG